MPIMAMVQRYLNIQYGNGVSVVVRDRESLLHGEGKQFIQFNTREEGARGFMRNPMDVLNSLASKAQEPDYKFKRLYRNLYNPEFFLDAYDKIYAKEGNMTKGTDGKTIDGMSLERINNIIESLKDLSYKPKSAKRRYIQKKNGGQRPLGIPSIDDKLVQEVVRKILESIYEKSFSDSSHGFRPNRSCHTALIQISKTFTGTKWFIEGDIKGFFDNINHKFLINILRMKIDDEKFIQLIWKFLKAGYMEDWQFHKTYSGAPQGGTISPILSNIYLNELDRYMENLIKEFDKGKERKRNPEYRNYEYRISVKRKELKSIWNEISEEERKDKLTEIKNLRQKMTELNRTEPMDENYKRIKYVRYADDFLIGLIGGKDDAKQIKEKLTFFLQNLGLELSQEKTLITNSKDKARFLGYDIDVTRNESPMKDKTGAVRRTKNLKIRLLLPKEKWINNLLSKGALEIKGNAWKPIHRTYLKDLDDLEILSTYNSEIKGLYEYYKLALNARVLHKYKYIMEYSLYKTLAAKYRTSITKIINKFSINGKFGIKYKTTKGEKIRYFYDKGFKRQNSSNTNPNIDLHPVTLIYSSRTSLIERLQADICEWCGKTDVPIQMHHVRKLKDLKGKKLWEKTMIARKRKTMALCEQCHLDLHNGRLDG